jgi:hypothetical protein
MPRAHIVHGIMDRVGTAGLLGLVPYLEMGGISCLVPDYGWIDGLEAHLVNPLLSRTLRPYVQPGDLWIGHSNGCAIGYEVMAAGAPLGGMVLINPALDPDLDMPDRFWTDVYFNQGDEATVAAQLGRALGLTDRVWGEMGHSGYQGDCPSVHNVNCGAPVENLPIVSGHSDIFSTRCLPAWGPYIVERIRSRLVER